MNYFSADKLTRKCKRIKDKGGESMRLAAHTLTSNLKLRSPEPTADIGLEKNLRPPPRKLQGFKTLKTIKHTKMMFLHMDVIKNGIPFKHQRILTSRMFKFSYNLGPFSCPPAPPFHYSSLENSRINFQTMN